MRREYNSVFNVTKFCLVNPVCDILTLKKKYLLGEIFRKSPNEKTKINASYIHLRSQVCHTNTYCYQAEVLQARGVQCGHLLQGGGQEQG